MHDSVLRLLNCAKTATAGLPTSSRVTDYQSLQRRLDISSATLTNWKARGVSKIGLIKAEKLFGCPASWLRDGPGTYWGFKHSSNEGSSTSAVAHDVSYPNATVLPSHIHWGDLMDRPLEMEFQTTAPDDAMAPDVPKGSLVIFVRGVTPLPGDFVLVADATGTPFIREYKELRPGHWQAHARNPAYLPLDSQQHDLQVIAVFDGVRGRRARQ